MGEYEERYPDAYGRDETAGQPPEAAELYLPPRQHRQSTLYRTRFAPDIAAENASDRQHAAAGRPDLVEPTASVRQWRASYRGLGPRGYIRSDQRIYEDICDRLTEHPFIDCSQMTVSVHDRIVTLAGSVHNMLALAQAEEISREVAGVTHVRNELIIAGDERSETTAGDEVNRAMAERQNR